MGDYKVAYIRKERMADVCMEAGGKDKGEKTG